MPFLWWQRLKTKFRKHNYDLDNGIVVVCDNIRIDGRPVTYTKYVCTKCGKKLVLSLGQMKLLPFPLSHGCPGIEHK